MVVLCALHTQCVKIYSGCAFWLYHSCKWPPLATNFLALWVWELFGMTNIENSCSFLFSLKPFWIDDAYHCTLFPIKWKLKTYNMVASGGHYFNSLGMGAIRNDKYWKFVFSLKLFWLDDAYHCTLFPIKHKLKYLFTLAAFGGYFSCFFGMGAISNDKYWKFKLDMFILNLTLI